MATIQKITPCLWFDDQAQAAAEYYTAIFPDSRMLDIAYYPDAGQEIHGKPAGSVLTVAFELAGQRFTALNGGPSFKFNEAVSLQVNCDTQEEIDYYWSRLSQGGAEQAQQCGWLADKYGLSWQIVPTVITPMLLDPDSAKAARVMTALLKMKKLDIAQLQQAYRA
jgi:predicted 3-demethylubiquinone-9 3-methyltransferase (glyoxalase superfamily)